MNTTFSTVRRETLEAYADSHPIPLPNAYTRRKLDWKASASVSRDEAIKIMQETCPSYNLFAPNLLKKLPADAKVTLAREGSVCIYVDKVGAATAESMKADKWFVQYLGTDLTRIWWD